jgi:hypothetical protein
LLLIDDAGVGANVESANNDELVEEHGPVNGLVEGDSVEEDGVDDDDDGSKLAICFLCTQLLSLSFATKLDGEMSQLPATTRYNLVWL